MSATPFTTDVAALAAFDPDVLRHRVREPRNWWREAHLLDLSEMEERRCAIWPIGREGSFRVALRQAEALDPDEAARATGAVLGLGLKVISGEIFVGAAERLPGAGMGERLSHIPDTGALVSVPPGDYVADLHVLRWRDEDRFYDEDGEIVPEAPADFVVLLRPADPASPPELPDDLPDLLDLLPKAEAKGRAKVGLPPRRRRSDPEPAPRRARRTTAGGAPTEGPSGPPQAPRHVPAEVGPYDPEQIRDAFREVLYGAQLHPPTTLPLASIAFRPRDRTLLAQDVALDVLDKKLTRVREQLRMLEAKVNQADDLDLVEKLELEGGITNVYLAVDGLYDALARELAEG